MKKLFDDETANYLGYQKYWPQRSDWLFAIAGVLLFMVIVFGGTFEIMRSTGYLDRQEKKQQDMNNAISAWCGSTIQKNLSETKECLNIK